ncbi:hypothetical protein QAD02_012665 [Eretmocerus hayati]|uniref:Uncharacterized protein n=1 Tax=Eretmocerus hayati TaxID=131215 RepID=A0ACC2P197_9HYME|nr:hypothetical protein QAD02_012665 [Eretmocerus hayati]
MKNEGDLLKVDLKNVSCLRSVKMVDIGFAASASLNAVENLKEVENQSFRSQCQEFVIAICQKLQKDSSLSYEFVIGASCSSPFVMQMKSTAKLRADRALSYLVHQKRLNDIVADGIKREYSLFINSRGVQEKRRDFDIKTDRLDTFLNEIMMKERMSGGIDNIEITNKMRKAFLGSSKNRKNAVEKKDETGLKERQLERRATDVIEEIKLKRQRLLDTAAEEARLLNEEVKKWERIL